MKRFLSIAALALPLLSACGEKEERPYFQVLGQAEIEKEAEIFVITAQIAEHGKNRLQTLESTSTGLTEIRRKLAALEGLDGLQIRTSKVQTLTVREMGCASGRAFGAQGYPESCAPIDHRSVITLNIEGEPAAAAGPVVSLLTELGAENVSLERYDLKDRHAIELEARRLALKDATETAMALAVQASATLGPAVELRYGQPGREVRIFEELGEDGPVSGPVPGSLEDWAHQAQVSLDLPPDVVTIDARVAVKFALEK